MSITHRPFMRTPTDEEARQWNPHYDHEAIAREKAALLARIEQLRVAVDQGYSMMADGLADTLPRLLQRWNASRAGFDGAIGVEKGTL